MYLKVSSFGREGSLCSGRLGEGHYWLGRLVSESMSDWPACPLLSIWELLDLRDNRAACFLAYDYAQGGLLITTRDYKYRLASRSLGKDFWCTIRKCGGQLLCLQGCGCWNGQSPSSLIHGIFDGSLTLRRLCQ